MADWYRRLLGARHTQSPDDTRREREHLERLLARFENERVAIDNTLTAATARVDELKTIGVSLDHMIRTAADLSARAADLRARIDTLDERVARLDMISGQIDLLHEAVSAARRNILELRPPTGAAKSKEPIEADQRGHSTAARGGDTRG